MVRTGKDRRARPRRAFGQPSNGLQTFVEPTVSFASTFRIAFRPETAAAESYFAHQRDASDPPLVVALERDRRSSLAQV
jgi:hypothetical protein